MALGFRVRSHQRSHSHSPSTCSTSSTSSASTSAPTPTSAKIQEAARLQPGAPRRVAIVGTGREALALSPNSANEFAQSLNLNMAVCSSPEINMQFANLPPNPNPGPVRELRRIASEAVVSRPLSVASTSKLPPAPRGLPPPPRPHRRRPPPVFVSTVGTPIAMVEQGEDAPTPRASSVPPSAASSFWGCAGPGTARSLRTSRSYAKSLRTSRSYASHMGSISTVTSDSDLDLDLDGLDAQFDEFEFSDDEGERERPREKSPLGGTYFPPSGARGVAPALRVQVSIEQVAYRDGSPHVHQFPARWEHEEGEDGIKTRAAQGEQVQPRAKVSLGKALGRWLKKRT